MNVTEFFAGIAVATLSASGLFFFRFWKQSHDHFYLLFALAMGLLAVERAALIFIVHPVGVLSPEMHEGATWIYLIRLVAFLAILWAIIDKNRPNSHPSK